VFGSRGSSFIGSEALLHAVQQGSCTLCISNLPL
jgi:hypothetical protein